MTVDCILILVGITCILLGFLLGFSVAWFSIAKEETETITMGSNATTNNEDIRSE